MTERRPFSLPAAWRAEPYSGHWSFAYEPNVARRADYDFRVHFTASARQPERLRVIRLLEASPRLLAFAAAIARMTQDGEEVDGRVFVMENDGAVATLNELIDDARRLTGGLTGRESCVS